MAINPLNPAHRQQLTRAVEHSRKELDRFSRIRDTTIRAYLGVSRFTPEYDWLGKAASKKYEKALPKGNLLQSAALNLQIALAYGEPEVLAVARTAEHYGMAYKLDPAVNRMAKLLDVGETARAVAADSFFGYGIFKVGIGELGLAAQQATGLTYGPCIWRVSQDDYIYDVTADRRPECAYEGDLYSMSLEEALERWPNDADRLNELADSDQFDSPHVIARPTQFYAPERRVWLLGMYFPAAKLVAVWPVRHNMFTDLYDAPLQVLPYNGHWSGVYEVLNHLYSPDELVPIAQAESSKALHILFNDVLELTANQARAAKINPLYQQGAEKDMKRIWDATDRYPVGVVDPSRFGQLEIPGPSQSQTAYMAAIMQLFKEMNPTTDDPRRVPTATQATLGRETTNAIVAEARRKFGRSLELVYRKLGDLLIKDNSITLPSQRPLLPGSRVMVDSTWLPSSAEPRTGQIDDFDISMIPFSTVLRTPEERRDLLLSIIDRVTVIMQQRAQGAPINVEKTLEMMARYSGLPEIMELMDDLNPTEQAVRQQSQHSAPRPGAGHYIRENVSTRNNAGAFVENMQEAGTENGQTRME